MIVAVRRGLITSYPYKCPVSDRENPLTFIRTIRSYLLELREPIQHRFIIIITRLEKHKTHRQNITKCLIDFFSAK